MGSKRGTEKIETLRGRLYEGMERNGITGEVADDIYRRIQAFANFGFAESHAISFALLVYASAWLRLHYPAAFTAALLRAQPMGFYAPHTLVADARRHGVRIGSPDVNLSLSHPGLEAIADGPSPAGTAHHSVTTTASLRTNRRRASSTRSEPFDTDDHRRDGGFLVRLGLAEVKGIGAALAEHVVAERQRGGPYASMADLSRRAGLTASQLEALGAAGAFDSLGLDRRQALWEAGTASADREGSCPTPWSPCSLPCSRCSRRRSASSSTSGPRGSPRRPPPPAPASESARSRIPLHGGPPRHPLRHPRGGRRGRHPPSTSLHSRRSDLHEPRGRARDPQRDLLRRSMEPLPAHRQEAPALLVRGILERSDEE
ncbi:helix-hairpin-helix domain-containing protein [Rathayibacter oskolensis]|uniref:helix-hairpin-helix domain-containing protein n=1 Tax=Rathayibacter oskolensis TaxID=1891671 RepID=UPI0034670F78